ncbi:YaaA family protein [Sulfurimonas sp. SAG-AH-194-I05]|nr:YaaA family protein [Sulfurimonas sp. SAG-AH-194-I05]MDF1874875.1 YaaA family protein [Sulfurimonas sp. SAG-AH-194-I05]
MLKILFSPSEGKNSGGDAVKKDLLGAIHARDEILDAYNTIIKTQDEEQIKALFGIKKFSDCEQYISDIYNAPLMPAMQRYQGVAYDYLKYNELKLNEQEYLKNNTIIFSNLFGPLRGGDVIPNYKVKQGNSVGSIVPEKFYKERFSYQLDLLLAQDEILDLRAGYYDKFYKLTRPYTTLKFLKNGKTVSHWAKAYRGIVLKELAKNNIQSIEEFKALQIDTLEVHEIKVAKNKTEIIYNIIE